MDLKELPYSLFHSVQIYLIADPEEEGQVRSGIPAHYIRKIHLQSCKRIFITQGVIDLALLCLLFKERGDLFHAWVFHEFGKSQREAI